MNELFDKLDADKDGALSKEEIVAAAARLGLTEDQAGALFDKLDKDDSGLLTREVCTPPPKHTQHRRAPRASFCAHSLSPWASKELKAQRATGT